MKCSVLIAVLLGCVSAAAQDQGPVIAGVSFDSTPLEDALDYLAAQGRETSPVPVSFVLIEPEALVTGEKASASGDGSGFSAEPAPSSDAGGLPAAQSIGSRPVTLALNNVPLIEVVGYVCDLARVSHFHDGGGVFLVGQPEDLKPVLESRPLRRQMSSGGAANLRHLAAQPVAEILMDDAPLSDLASFLEGAFPSQPDQRAVNVIIREGGDRPIHLNLVGQSALSVINYATDQTRLGYRADAFALVIGVPEQLAAASPAGNLPAPLTSKLAPEVILQDVTLTDVVALVRSAGGVNVLMEDGVGDRRLSLSLRNIPLSEVLRYAAELTGSTLSYDGRAIKLGSR